MGYKETERKFLEYIEGCRKNIFDTFFGSNSSNLGIQDTSMAEDIIENRNNMIQSKLNHTMRMIVEIEKVNKQLNLQFNFQEVMKVAILLHDLGRFRQATWSNLFADTYYATSKYSYFKNHGEDGYDIFYTNDFAVPKQYQPSIGLSILYHVDPSKNAKLGARFNGDLSKYNIDDVLTGNHKLNEGEWQAASIIVNMVADIDRLDILHQFIIGEINVVRGHIYDSYHDSLDAVSARWGVSKEEILDYNHITEQEYKNTGIKVPIANMDLNKIAISDEYKEMFYSGEWLPLRELINRKDWNFVCAMWWRLSVFVNQITFTSSLNLVRENELLKKIYATIPDNLKFLFTEAFTYAEEVLVNERLDKKSGEIYL